MSPDQPLPFRRRTDLVIVAVGAATPRWSVKDPLSQRFYQLRQAEHFILQQLDGKTSLKDLVQRFSKLFFPQQITLAQVTQFVQQLWLQGLLIVDHPAQASLLIATSRQQQGRSRWQWLANPLAIRFRGIDPDRFLTAMLPVVSWLLSTPLLIAAALFIVSGAVVALSELPQILRELRTSLPAMTGSQLSLMFALIAGIKVCHELGHAFVCKRMGGECHELGLMLLVGMPCLYCNVTDAWLLKSRWKRAAVGAAGMGVELVFAAMATWVWALSQPGLIHTLALPIMLFCSVNTLLLNGNPLLRYDGYYILTDLVDVPNLRPRAMAVLQRWWMKLLWGVAPGGPAGSWYSTFGLGLYGFCSWLYLWSVLGVILWVLYQWLEPFGLGALVVAAAVLMLGGRCWSGIRRFRLLFRQALQSTAEVGEQGAAARAAWGRGRIYLTTALLPLVLIALLFVPFPRSVSGPVRIVAEQEKSVFVTVPGLVEFGPGDSLTPGQQVQQNASLWQLTNWQLQREQLELQTSVQRQERRRQSLENRLNLEPQLAAELSSTESTLRDLKDRLSRHEEKLQRLLLIAPQAGELVAGKSRQAQPLPGRPEAKALLDTQARQVWLRTGDEAARIVSDERAAIVYVEHSDLPELQRDHRVKLSLPEAGGCIVTGRIQEVAVRPLESVPEALLLDGRYPVRMAEGTVQFQSPVHEVRITLDDTRPTPHWLNQTGTARIALKAEPLWQHAARLLRRTFPGLD